MYEFSTYVPQEPGYDGYFRVGVDLGSYLRQAKLESLLDKKENIVSQIVLLNGSPYKVYSWELDEGCFILSVLPEEKFESENKKE